jgi:hypothetical protein
MPPAAYKPLRLLISIPPPRRQQGPSPQHGTRRPSRQYFPPLLDTTDSARWIRATTNGSVTRFDPRRGYLPQTHLRPDTFADHVPTPDNTAINHTARADASAPSTTTAIFRSLDFTIHPRQLSIQSRLLTLRFLPSFRTIHYYIFERGSATFRKAAKSISRQSEINFCNPTAVFGCDKNDEVRDETM